MSYSSCEAICLELLRYPCCGLVEEAGQGASLGDQEPRREQTWQLRPGHSLTVMLRGCFRDKVRGAPARGLLVVVK